jgi:diguanylate cyclase (GGDEF)-like protein/PAS domain S-box-containing protein
MNCEINAYNYVNKEMSDFFGLSSDELIHNGPEYVAQRIHPLDATIYQDHLYRINLAEDEEVVESEYRIKNCAGNWKWINFRSVVFQRNSENQPKLILYVGKDITDHKEIENQLRFVSIHDQLTGLYNRHYFEEEMIRLEKGRLYPISIVMADIDGLKMVNDTCGHATGDRMLIRSAELLRESFRAEDVVARIGGDEFAALLPGADELSAEKVCARIRTIFSRQSDSEELHVHISIGTGTVQKGGSLSETLKIADASMYSEKMARKASMANKKRTQTN